MDTTAAEVLADLYEELNAQDVHLAFAELKDPVKDTFVRYGLLGRDGISTSAMRSSPI